VRSLSVCDLTYVPIVQSDYCEVIFYFGFFIRISSLCTFSTLRSLSFSLRHSFIASRRHHQLHVLPRVLLSISPPVSSFLITVSHFAICLSSFPACTPHALLVYSFLPFFFSQVISNSTLVPQILQSAPSTFAPFILHPLHSAALSDLVDLRYDTIRYHTIGEFNVDSKAEYTA